MSQFEQRKAARGSQKWLQCAINADRSVLDSLLLPKLRNVKTITWCSPLKNDQYAEYRDAAFLQKIGREDLTHELEEFWPPRGPQWDGLAQCDNGSVILVEAKAHIGELFSTCLAQAPESLKKIHAALDETAEYLRVKRLAPWTHFFYQLANRIAHVYFLRNNGVDAYLVLIIF
jgi:hypothetical protein